MLRKRFCSLSIAFLLFLSTSISSFAATPLGQDGNQGYPIDSGMETEAEVSAINSQIAGASGSAILSQDRKSGKYACELNTGGVGTSYVQFTAAESASYDASDFGEIHLYVKPKRGAEWIRFYSNNGGTNELIKSDGNQDGTFDVGGDLISGVWNEVSLKLIDTDTTLTTASDLVIQTNGSAIWGLDEIKALKTSVFTYDLTSFLTSQTALTSSRLQLASSGTGTFNTTGEVLISGLEQIEIKDDTQAEFSAGTFNGTEMVGNTMVGMDISSGGTVISSYEGQTYISSNAFDSDIDTFWRGQRYGSAVIGVDYIGYNFGAAKVIKEVRVRQSYKYNNTVASMKLQYFDGIWKDAQTLTSANLGDLETFYIDASFSSSQWRLLANAAVNGATSSYYWEVCEVQFIDNSEKTYTSAVKSLTGLTAVKNIACSWLESKSGELAIEVRISSDGGSNWTEWQKAINGEVISAFKGTGLTSGKIQYRSKFTSGSLLRQMTIDIEGDSIKNELPEGKISGIRIDRDFYDSGNNIIKDLKKTYTILNSPIVTYGLSGDGTKILYRDPTGSNYLKMLDLNTGLSSTIAGNYAVPVNTKIELDYDGTYGIIGGVLYDLRRTSPVYDYPSAMSVCDMNSSGDIFVASSSIVSSWSKFGFASYFGTSGNFTSNIAVADVPSFLLSYSGSKVLIYKPDYFEDEHSQTIYEDPDADQITSAMITPAGKSVVFTVYHPAPDYTYDYFRYDIDTKVLRELTLPKGASQFAAGSKLFSDNSYYDLDTDKTIEFEAAEKFDITNFQMSNDGGIMVYATANALKRHYVSGVSPPDRYLLSFDGKNSWYSCRNGIWSLVKSGMAPSTAEIKEQGMTLEEINGLSDKDFAKLYAGGKEIYTVDLAIYYASPDASLTPAISSIAVLMDAGRDAYETGKSYSAVYAAKSKEFIASDMRSISKIYPVEITPKAAEIYYFVKIGNVYKSMIGGTFTDVGTLPLNADSSWLTVTQLGITAAELRQIKGDVLTANLITGNTTGAFSIVYCLKAYDESTIKYRSDIYIDSTKDLFESVNLTLNIQYADGTNAQYTGLTHSDVEDFTAWILARQFNKGPIFYLIRSGSNNEFINYYMIQKINVVEL